MIRFLLQDSTSPDAGARQLAHQLILASLSIKRWAVVAFRFSQLAGRRVPAMGSAIKQLNHLVSGADLAWQATIGSGLQLHHPTGVVWGPGVVVGHRCIIQQGVTIGGRGGSGVDGSPHIGDDVTLGSGAKLMGPIRIGSRSLIGANAVVIGDVPDDSVAVGVPARVISTRKGQ